MLPEDDRPIGAVDLPLSRRDRLSIWIAQHRWIDPLIRVAAGLALVAVVALVSDADLPYDKVIAFVVGAILGGRAGEHERERGDTLLDVTLGGDPVPPDLPSEFAEHVHRPPDPRSPGPHYRPR